MDSSSSIRSVSPYLLYDDVTAAIEWLACAFGFQETIRHEDHHGVTISAELRFGVDRVMLARTDCARDEVPCPSAMVYVAVEDVEAHFLRAKEAMASIVCEPRDTAFGIREYCVDDPEGHRWVFAQQIRDVLPVESAGPQRQPVRTLLSSPFVSGARAGRVDAPQCHRGL